MLSFTGNHFQGMFAILGRRFLCLGNPAPRNFLNAVGVYSVCLRKSISILLRLNVQPICSPLSNLPRGCHLRDQQCNQLMAT